MNHGSGALNLKDIRLGLTPDRIRPADGGETLSPVSISKVSRRSFLQLAGAAVPVPNALRTLAQSQFGLEMIERADRVAFCLGGIEKWVIDPKKFSGRPRTKVMHRVNEVEVRLSDAFYPGTTTSADFVCELNKGSGDWLMKFSAALGEFRAQVSFVNWLNGNAMARGRVQLQDRMLSSSPGLGRLVLRGAAEATFNPDWSWWFRGSGIGYFSIMGEELVSDDVEISLKTPAHCTLFPLKPQKRTVVTLLRGTNVWRLAPPVTATASDSEDWELFGVQGLFDRLTIEAGEDATGTTAVAFVADSPERCTEMMFRPSAGLLNEDGTRFHVGLQKARLAAAATSSGVETALIAEYSPETVSAFGPAYRIDLGASPDGPPFELVALGEEVKHLIFNPGLFQVHAPIAGAVTEPCRLAQKQGLKDPATERSSWEWWRVVFWPPNWGHSIKCLPMSALPPVRVVRTQDLAVLEFSFDNFVLEKGKNGIPRLVVPKHSTSEGVIKVSFPPQSITEQAFWEYDPNFPIQKKLHDGSDDPDKGRCKTPSASDCENPSVPPVAARMAGRSLLVFTLPIGEHMVYTIEGLLDWSKLKPVLVDYADGPKTPDDIDKTPSISDPQGQVTAIESPYRLFVSPNSSGSWVHSKTVTASEENRTELWHTRLAVQKGGVVDENAVDGRTLRAIWSPDYQMTHDRCTWPDDLKPFRMSLNRCDRHEIVRLTSDYFLDGIDTITTLPDGKRRPVTQRTAPIHANRLMLSALGAFMDTRGVWEPPKMMRVEEWVHRSTLARDHYVKVVYKGYLYPLGHQASLIKVTERKFEKTAKDGYIAYLRQRMFIVIRERVKYYPALGQPFSGRRFPFQRVEFSERDSVTPDIDPPIEIGGDSSLYNFWPLVHGVDFNFNFTAWDQQGPKHLSCPLIFVDNIVAHDDTLLSPVVTEYQGANNRSRRHVEVRGQIVAYGPSTKPGDTSLPTEAIRLLADQPDKDARTRTALKGADQPPFYPGLAFGAVHVHSVEQFTGAVTVRDVQFPRAYLDRGFDASSNAAELFAEMSIVPEEGRDVYRTPLFLTFGGPAGNNGDRSGGLATPNTRVVGLSRRIGPVGGQQPPGSNNASLSFPPPPSGLQASTSGMPSADITARAQLAGSAPTPDNPALSNMLAGKFNPLDFFGGAMSDAKLLGVVKLSDVVEFVLNNAVGNLGDAPQIIRKTLYDVEGVAGKALSEIVPIIDKAASAIDSKLSSSDFPSALQQRLHPEWQALRRALKELNAAAKLLGNPDASIRDQGITAVLTAQADLVQAGTTLLDDCKLIAADPLRALGIDVQFLTNTLTGAGGILAKVAPLVNTVNQLQEIYTNSAALLQQFVQALNGSAISADGKEYLKRVSKDLQAIQDRVVATFGALSTEIGIVVGSIQNADLRKVLELTARFQKDVQELRTRLSQLLDAIQKQPTTIGPKLDTLLKLPTLMVVDDYQQTRADLENSWNRLSDDIKGRTRNLYGEAQGLLRQIQDTADKSYTDQLNAGQVVIQQKFLTTLSQLYELVPDNVPAPAGGDVFTLRDRLVAAGKRYSVFGRYLTDANSTKQSLDDVAGLLTGSLKESVTPSLLDFKNRLVSPVLENGPVALGDLDLIRDRSTYALLMAGGVISDGVTNALRTAQTAIDNSVKAYEAVVRTAAGNLRDILIAFQTQLPDVFQPAVHTLLAQLISDLNGFAVGTFGLSELPRILQDFAQLRDQIGRLISNPVEGLAKLVDLQKLGEEFLQQCGIPSTVALSFDWNPPLQSFPSGQPIFEVLDGEGKRGLSIKAEAVVNLRRVEPPVFNITGTLTKFRINLLAQPNFIKLTFSQLQFSSHSGGPVQVVAKLEDIKFGEALKFVAELAKLLNPSTGPFLDIQPTGITAGFRLGWPMLPVGALLVYDLRLYAGVTLPFTGDPMRLRFGVSDAAEPFLLQVGVWAGGGFLNLEMDGQGLQRVEGALEFGAHVELDLGGVAKGSGYILGGIYFNSERQIQPSGTAITRAKLCGFVRAGGELSIIGIISMSLDIYVKVCWQAPNNVYGTATITVEIHMLFFSTSVSVTSSYTFAGSQQTNEEKVRARTNEIAAAADVSGSSMVGGPQPVWASDFDWGVFQSAFHS